MKNRDARIYELWHFKDCVHSRLGRGTLDQISVIRDQRVRPDDWPDLYAVDTLTGEQLKDF